MGKRITHGRVGGFSAPASCISVCEDSKEYFATLGLSLFLLPLNYTRECQQGLEQKLLRNNSFVRTAENPSPPPPPPHFHLFDDDEEGSKAERAVAKMAERRAPGTRGFLLLVTEPDTEQTQIAKPAFDSRSEQFRQIARKIHRSRVQTRPYTQRAQKTVAGCTVVFVENNGEWNERRVVAAFCNRSIPPLLAEELLEVVLSRALVEALYFDELSDFYDSSNKSAHQGVLSASSQNLRSPTQESDRAAQQRQLDTRFVSVESRELSFFPSPVYNFWKNRLRSDEHWDCNEVGGGPGNLQRPVQHVAKKCPCKAYSFKPGYYQFFGILGGTLKSILAINREPSVQAQLYFGTKRSARKYLFEVSGGSPSQTREEKNTGSDRSSTSDVC